MRKRAVLQEANEDMDEQADKLLPIKTGEDKLARGAC